MNWYKLAKQSTIDLPSFKQWFGNSKVVDAQGRPLVVYKGMYPHDWTKEQHKNGKIDPGPEVDRIQRPTEFPALHKDEKGFPIAGFFGGKETAGHFATLMRGAVYPVYLSLQHPYEVDAKGEKAGNIQFGASGKPFRDAMRSGQFDGAIIRNTDDEGTIYVACYPTQIKSAISNTRFDATNPRFNE